MPDLFKKALELIVGDQPAKARPLKKFTTRELIRLESEIGREVFGAVPKNVRREFFCLDASTWIWHEEVTDPTTKKVSQLTTRYEVHPNGILKVQDGAPYTFIEGKELENLNVATALYYERVMRGLYHRDPRTGKTLA